MKDNFCFYVYMYLRNKESKTGKIGTPYYVGKGKGNRFKERGKREHIKAPKDKTYIVILERNLSEIGAFALERRYIRWWGRISEGGILRNLADGGQGVSGLSRPMKEETKLKISNTTKGRKKQPFTTEHKNNISESHKGKIVDLDTRFKLSKKLKGRKLSNGNTGIKRTEESKKKSSNSMKSKPRVYCTHCGKSGNSGSIARFHNSNCKHKKEGIKEMSVTRLQGFVQKGWGGEYIFATNDKYCGKILMFNEGSEFSMHFHQSKTESWYILDGEFEVECIDTKDASIKKIKLIEEDTWHNEPLLPHKLKCIQKGRIIEVSTPDSVEDNYRVLPGDSQRQINPDENRS